MDLESFEMSIRSSMHQIGGRMLEALINADGGITAGGPSPVARVINMNLSGTGGRIC